MKRLKLIGSWKRLGVQAGVLVGLGLAFATASEQPAVAGGNDCPDESMCTFKKPNFMFIMDYSSSMMKEFAGSGTTRWASAKSAVSSIIMQDSGYFDKNMHLALLRYGHDPDPDMPGTMIASDMSGLVDGQKLDVDWYDRVNSLNIYHECTNGQAILSFLDDVPNPPCVGVTCSGIGTWTKGALDYADALIEETKADHPDDIDMADPTKNRFYATMLLTDGLWTDVVGTPNLNPPEQDPVNAAGPMYDDDGVKTYVVAFGEAAEQPFADALAAAGGTSAAISAANPADLVLAIDTVLNDIKNSILVPECTKGLPRIMIILDASSSMLNVDMVAGAQGETGWDQAREALAGTMSIFDAPVGTGTQVVEDLVHLGLIVFGHQDMLDITKGEEKLLVQYGPCMKDNLDWALDPQTSCDAPGCTDPWGGPPITWTFKGPTQNTFNHNTYSHMPKCDVNPMLPTCAGSGTYTHRGLALARQNIEDYKLDTVYPADDGTQFVNILITDGQYATYSTNAQVANELSTMYDDGIRTYVIGFGDGLADPMAQNQLASMACWGSGGAGGEASPAGVANCIGGDTTHYDASNQAELSMVLEDILENVTFDPCCAFNDCSQAPEPDLPATTGADESSTGTTATDTSAGSTGGLSDTGSTGDDAGTGEDSTTDTDSATGTRGGDAETGDESTTDTASATNTTTETDTMADDTGIDGSSDDSGGASGGSSDDGSGCSCSVPTTEGERTHALLATLMTLGLAGAVRRRRRAA